MPILLVVQVYDEMVRVHVYFTVEMAMDAIMVPPSLMVQLLATTMARNATLVVP